MILKNRVLPVLAAFLVVFALMLAASALPMTDGTVHAATKTVNRLDISCSLSVLNIDPNFTLGYVNDRVKANATGEITGGYLDLGNTSLSYWVEEEDKMYGIADGAGKIEVSVPYYLGCNFILYEGYDWPAKAKEIPEDKQGPLSGLTGLSVYFNGVRVTDGYAQYNRYWNELTVFVPVGKEMVSTGISQDSFTYDGNVHKPEVKAVQLKNGSILHPKYYTVSYVDAGGSEVTPKNAGRYNVKIKGLGMYNGVLLLPFTIEKAANPLKVKAKTAKVRYSKLKKKTQKLDVTKVMDFAPKGQGSMSYKIIKGNKKITINKTTGQVTVKKKLKKGTYKVTAEVTAKGNTNYKASSAQKVTFKVKVK